MSLVVESSFYQSRLISKAKPYIPRKDLEKRIHAFVTSRLVYCNSLYAGLHSALVQNGTGRFESITPVLSDLHWLPIKIASILKSYCSRLKS